MEQLIWSIIIIAFIIFTALKNRARNRPNTNSDRTSDVEHKTRDEHDRLGKYMEELLGIERTEAEPRIEIDRETQEPFNEVVTPGEEPEAEKKIGQFETPLHRERQKPPLPEKREICHSKFPWGALSKKDLPNAIILSEIIGPPISKRKSHRLF
ncbi:MAG: hypothetical protein R2568_10400 [Candidatus Scalindua sp.]|jgi:hypothetical protein|nr:hypothetical protein [Candidatus Scalindua sp.]MDV5167137.1 hypothetical protein [Candidatus Scalindua sp.]